MRAALWRALHVQVDPPPHVLDDVVGLQLVGPRRRLARPPRHGPGRHQRVPGGDRGPRPLHRGPGGRAGRRGVTQYVILGAGLDTFAQRRPEIGARLRIFEVDQPGTQAWKRRRLVELGFGVPDWLRLVPVDFEAGGSWWERLAPPASTRSAGGRGVHRRQHVPHQGRDRGDPAPARRARPGSTLAMTFLLPRNSSTRPTARARGRANGARASGTPFISFFTPQEMLALAREAGFEDARHVSGAALAERYFAGRPTACARRAARNCSSPPPDALAPGRRQECASRAGPAWPAPPE